MKTKFLLVSFLCLISVLTLNLFPVAANSTIPSLVPMKGDYEKAYNTGNYTLNDFVQTGVNITKIILGTVGSLALMMFVYGGVMMLISSGSSEKVAQAKGIIMAAVVGLVIIFASYIIVSFVIKAINGDSSMVGDWSSSTIQIK